MTPVDRVISVVLGVPLFLALDGYERLKRWRDRRRDARAERVAAGFGGVSRREDAYHHMPEEWP